LDEIEPSLALDVTPPIGMGRDFLGTCDLFADALLLFERGVHDRVTEPIRCNGLDDPPPSRSKRSSNCARRSMAKGLCPPFDLEAHRAGHLTRSISAAHSITSEYANYWPESANWALRRVRKPPTPGQSTRSTATASPLCGSPPAAFSAA
jgi:hypothetical protein